VEETHGNALRGVMASSASQALVLLCFESQLGRLIIWLSGALAPQSSMVRESERQALELFPPTSHGLL